MLTQEAASTCRERTGSGGGIRMGCQQCLPPTQTQEPTSDLTSRPFLQLHHWTFLAKKKKKIKCWMLCLQQNKIQWHKFKQYRQVCNQSYKILSCLSPYSIPWGICSLYCFCFKWLLIIIPLNHIVIQGQLAPGEKKSHLKWTHLKWRSKFHSKWWLGDYLGNWN